MEKHREMQKEVQIAFVDLETAYDRVPRQELLFGGCFTDQGTCV